MIVICFETLSYLFVYLCLLLYQFSCLLASFALLSLLLYYVLKHICSLYISFHFCWHVLACSGPGAEGGLPAETYTSHSMISHYIVLYYSISYHIISYYSSV